jgi:biopolymer transport protein ExbB
VKKLLSIALIFCFVAAAWNASAQDAREAVKKADAERAAALERAKQIEEQILNDRTKLVAEVEKLEAERVRLDTELTVLEKKVEETAKHRETLSEKWAGREIEFKEISGNVRVVARDLEALLLQSPVSALVPGRVDTIKPLFDTGYFPGIDDITGMANVLFDEIERSGQVRLAKGSFVGRDGQDLEGDILVLGKFTSIYRSGKEVGFLQYDSGSEKFFALTALPPRPMRRTMNRYLDGKGADVPFDISAGSAFLKITQGESLLEHLGSGGPVMWPIYLVALAALGIVLQRVWYLEKVRQNTGKYMTRVNKLASEGNWEECEAIVKRHKGEHSPVNHVIEAGLTARHLDREMLESVLQEALIREIPRVERGLSALAVLGAVAPLLGLLGTVTGMIETFRVITLHGTGNPKLMSGGISEALITTEVGLVIAIPVILLHMLLSRRAAAIIGDMEEKAVSLTNIIELQKKADHALGAAQRS